MRHKPFLAGLLIGLVIGVGGALSVAGRFSARTPDGSHGERRVTDSPPRTEGEIALRNRDRTASPTPAAGTEPRREGEGVGGGAVSNDGTPASPAADPPDATSRPLATWNSGQILAALQSLAAGDMAARDLPEPVYRIWEELSSRFPDLDVPEELADRLLLRPDDETLWWLGAHLKTRRGRDDLMALLRRAAEGDPSDSARPIWYASRYVAYAVEARGTPVPDGVAVGLLQHEREPARLAGLALASHVATPSDSLFDAVRTMATSDEEEHLRAMAVDLLADLASGPMGAAHQVAIADTLIEIAKTGESDARAAAVVHLPGLDVRASDVALRLLRDGYLDPDVAHAVIQELVATGRLPALLDGAREPGYVRDVAHAVVAELDHDNPRNPAALRDAELLVGTLAAAATDEDLPGLLRVALRGGLRQRLVAFVTDSALPLRVRVAALEALRSHDETVGQAIDMARSLAVSTSVPADLRVRAINLLAEESESTEWVALLRDVASNDANPRVRDAAADALRRILGPE